MDKKSFNVLIIDDTKADHELYHEYLSDTPDCSYNFFHAYTGGEGEQLYQSHDVDCVIIDYRLPDINGLEVLKRLTSIREIVPAVMLTGEGSEAVAVVAMQLGSQDYIPKRVVTPEALRRTVERASERSKLMRQMEAYRQDLERSNQDLERFVSVAAHDLKSPLRAISQHLHLVVSRTHGQLDEKCLRSINFAVEGAERMRELIDALFEFSRAGFEKHEFSVVNCNLILSSVKSNLASHIEEKNAEITSGILPTLTADSMQVMQLMQNLIGNALKFCKEKPKIHVSARMEDDHWVFSVQDNGIGIPKAAQEKIFTIFRRLHTEEEYPGAGIGLAICERVVANHGGHIWVESEPGQGATFYFTLPAEAAGLQEKVA